VFLARLLMRSIPDENYFKFFLILYFHWCLIFQAYVLPLPHYI
jgi:hypothetical protein